MGMIAYKKHPGSISTDKSWTVYSDTEPRNTNGRCLGWSIFPVSVVCLYILQLLLLLMLSSVGGGAVLLEASSCSGDSDFKWNVPLLNKDDIYLPLEMILLTAANWSQSVADSF